METLYQLLAAIGAGLVLFILYQYIKGKPEQLSKTNLNRSFYAMGLLALVLIGVVFLLVLLVRQG